MRDQGRIVDKPRDRAQEAAAILIPGHPRARPRRLQHVKQNMPPMPAEPLHPAAAPGEKRKELPDKELQGGKAAAAAARPQEQAPGEEGLTSKERKKTRDSKRDRSQRNGKREKERDEKRQAKEMAKPGWKKRQAKPGWSDKKKLEFDTAAAKNFKSEHPGVYFSQGKGVWYSKVKVAGKFASVQGLSRFATEQEAIDALSRYIPETS